MTLAEALEVCDREYNNDVKSFTPESEHLAIRDLQNDYATIRNSTPFANCVKTAQKFLDRGDDPSLVIATFFPMMLRFGMRVERKLQRANAVEPLPTSESPEEPRPKKQ